MSIKWAPSDWKTYQVGDVLKRVSKPVIVESKAIYRQIGIRSHGKGIFHKNETTGAEIGNKRVFWIEPDCFVVNIVFAWERAVAQTSEAEQDMIASHRFPMYKPVKGLLDLDFITYFFKSEHGNRLLKLASPGGAGRNKTLGQQRFAKLEIPLPPIEEQHKIAEILGAWDEAITLTERLIEAKQKRKKGLMQQLLTGKVRFPGFEGEWETVRLKEIATVNAKTLSGKSDPEQVYYYIDLASVNRGKIDFPTYKERFANLPSRARRILSRSDIIMSTVRPNLLGFAVCDFPTADVLCSTGFALITPHNSKDKSFIYQCLYGSYIQRQIDALVTGSNYPAINSTEVKQIRILWPQSDKERHLIGQILSLCDDEIDLLQRKVAALREQKKGLMQQLLTGKVRVKV